jgi:hypothetical protein
MYDMTNPERTETMTKAETREVTKSIAYANELGDAYLARALSALYRAARTTKSQDDIMAVALAYAVVTNPEFIV